MKPIFIFLSLIVFAGTRLHAQPEYEALLHKTYAQRVDALKILIERLGAIRFQH